MGMTCTQPHMFYAANKAESQREVLIITFMHLFVILFFNLLKTTRYLAHTCMKNSNIMQYILQYETYRYSLLAILYCIAVVNIAINRYRYIDILFHPYQPS